MFCFFRLFFIVHENGFSGIGKMPLELDVTKTKTFAIGCKPVDLSVKLYLNVAAHRGRIVIMGDKEECQIMRIHARIIKGDNQILQAGYILTLAKCHP